MIRVFVERNHEKKIDRIQVVGHAHYDQPGKDIVCAAVSSVAIGITNAIEKIFHVKVHADDDGDGKIACTLPQGLDSNKKENIRLLMETMKIALQGIAEEFPRHVRIEEKTRKG